MQKNVRAAFAVMVLALAFSAASPCLASQAACEVVIWGNRLAADATAAAELRWMIDPSTKAGSEWLAKVNAVLARSSADLEALMESIPPAALAKPVGRDGKPPLRP